MMRLVLNGTGNWVQILSHMYPTMDESPFHPVNNEVFDLARELPGLISETGKVAKVNNYVIRAQGDFTWGKLDPNGIRTTLEFRMEIPLPFSRIDNFEFLTDEGRQNTVYLGKYGSIGASAHDLMMPWHVLRQDDRIEALVLCEVPYLGGQNIVGLRNPGRGRQYLSRELVDNYF